MIIIVIISVIVAITAVGFLIGYRRQISDVKRQLEFLKENKSVMRITYDMPFEEIASLCNTLNEFLDTYRESEQKVMRSDAALRETVVNLSHDIRTPLASLDGYFQQLEECSSAEERIRCRKVINNRISSLNSLLDELFAYAKLQDEQFSPEIDEVNFGKLVYDSAFSFYDDFVSAGIEPALEVCDERAVIEGNADGLRRVVSNIIKNALVHSVSQVRITLAVTEGKAVFSCENDIPEGTEIDASRIFDRFYKADVARSSTSTGLGLSIAKTLTERMGGEINADCTDKIFRIEVKFRSV